MYLAGSIHVAVLKLMVHVHMPLGDRLMDPS
jgi:hypothetical protein